MSQGATGTLSIKMHGKLAALGKHLGMFDQRTQKTQCRLRHLGRADVQRGMEQALRHPALRTERPSWKRNGQIPSRRAHQGRDCGAAQIQRIAENAPRWPDINSLVQPSSTWPSSHSPLCYPGLPGGTEGRLAPRFRTFQVCPKDLRAALRQAGGAEDRAHGSVSGADSA